MSDIVEQLRALKVETPYGSGNTLLHLLAAAEITRLRAALVEATRLMAEASREAGFLRGQLDGLQIFMSEIKKGDKV